MTTYFALWAFIIAMVATPGPANMLLMTAGAQQGLIKTLPFITGLIAGKLALNIALAFGLMRLIEANAGVAQIFIYGSAGYMAYLALRTWTPVNRQTDKNQFSFLAGTVVHPMSPKTWMMGTLAVTQFGGSFTTPSETLLVIPLSFLVAQVVFHSLWCLAGAVLSRVFEQSLVAHRALILLTLAVIVWAALQ